jgi:hypothetical protein
MSLTLRYLIEELLSWALSCLLDRLLDECWFCGPSRCLFAGGGRLSKPASGLGRPDVSNQGYVWVARFPGLRAMRLENAPLLLYWRLHVAITELANDGSILPSEDVPANT